MPTIDDAYWITHNSDDRVVDASPKVAEKLGLHISDLVGRRIETLIAPAQVFDFRVARKEWIEHGINHDLVWQIQTDSGDLFFATIQFEFINDRAQTRIRLNSVDLDRARQVIMHIPQSMRVARKHLKHDVISPLQMAQAVLTQVSVDCDPKNQHALSVVNERLSRISQDIERFSSIGLITSPRFHVSISTLTNIACKVLEKHFNKNCYEVSVRSTSDIPPDAFYAILDNLFTVIDSVSNHLSTSINFENNELSIQLGLKASSPDPITALQDTSRQCLRNQFLVNLMNILLLRHSITLSLSFQTDKILT